MCLTDVCIPPAVVLFLGSALHTHHTSAQNLSVLSVITHIHVHVILITDRQSTEYIIHVHVQCHVFSSYNYKRLSDEAFSLI